MDDAYVRAVMRFFVHLYERGWLFRDNRIVNWCSDCRTSISDLEVEHIDVDDALTYARYPLADGSGHVTIATVRPATILADVAVAVHPDDERYRDLVGKDVIVPVDRAPRAGHRRRARRARVRHGRAQGDAGPRPHRLRDRPRPRPARACGHRARRPHDRRHPGPPRRADRGGGVRLRRRLAPPGRAAREARELSPLGRPLRAQRDAHPAARVAAVVGGHGADGRRPRSTRSSPAA